MNFFENILFVLDGQGNRPPLYGWFHLLFLAITIVSTILICYKFKNCCKKTFKRIILISWIVLLVFEAIKQLISSFDFNGSVVSWNYPYWIFPLQLCSSILYMLPFVLFLKDGPVKDCFIAFLISFSLFGGTAVMVYPGNVFSTSIGVNIQTMVHHGMQVVVGVFLLVYYRHRLSIKYFLKAIPVFVVYVCFAMIINYVFAGQINMMYISPYINSDMPVAKELYLVVPFIVYFICMMAFYVFVGFATHFISFYLIKKLKLKKQKKNS